jgi:hypothetical protein
MKTFFAEYTSEPNLGCTPKGMISIEESLNREEYKQELLDSFNLSIADFEESK